MQAFRVPLDFLAAPTEPVSIDLSADAGKVAAAGEPPLTAAPASDRPTDAPASATAAPAPTPDLTPAAAAAVATAPSPSAAAAAAALTQTAASAAPTAAAAAEAVAATADPADAMEAMHTENVRLRQAGPDRHCRSRHPTHFEPSFLELTGIL